MVKNLKYILTIIILGACFTSYSQVTINVDEKINTQLRMKNAKIDETKVSGYRIQIAFSSDKSVANAAKSKFTRYFPELTDRVYPLYQQPYHKVRVGDFYREIDSQKLLKEIRVQFPNAFVVTDYINLPLIED